MNELKKQIELLENTIKTLEYEKTEWLKLQFKLFDVKLEIEKLKHQKEKNKIIQRTFEDLLKIKLF